MTGKMRQIKDIRPRDRRFMLPLLFLPCLFVLFRALDNDIWFLLNHGRYVFQNGIPQIEPFTIHRGLEFVMQQWLSACIFWSTYSAFSAIGLKVLVMLCYVLTVFIVYKLCMRVSKDYFFLSFTISMAVCLLLFLFMITRPYIFLAPILILELYLLESYIILNKKKYLYLLPVLSVLLINLQASMWPMLFVILVPYVIDSFKFKIGSIAGQGYEKNSLLWAIVAMLIIGFINPYGFKAMTYLFRSYGYKEISLMVSEMKPPNINSIDGLLIFGSILVLVLLYSCYRKGSTKLRYILLTLGTTYMAISSGRSFLFFIICGFFPLAYYCKDIELPIKDKAVTKKTLLLRKVLIGLIVLLLPLGAYGMDKSAKIVEHDYELLNEAILSINTQDDQSKVILYTGYNDGNLAQFQGIPSYIDTRAEVFLKSNNMKADIMKEYIDMQSGALYYKNVLDKYQFTHIIVTSNDILYTYLPYDKDYRIAYSNAKYTLFEKVS